jgi:hypothetical protein
MSNTITIRATRSPETIVLAEGKTLSLTGSASAAGTAYQLDPALGGTNSTKSWAISAGALAVIGPFVDTQRILVSCSVGSITATTQDGVTSLPQIIVSSAAPSNSDGRPDGTIYIQTA